MATKKFTTLPSGFRFDLSAAKAHVMEPVHTRGVSVPGVWKKE